MSRRPRLPRPDGRLTPMALALVARDRMPDTPAAPQPDAAGDTRLCGASLRQLRALMQRDGRSAPADWLARLTDAIALSDRALRALSDAEDYPTREEAP